MKNIKSFQQFNESIDAKQRAYSFKSYISVEANELSDAEDKASTLEFEGVEVGFLDLQSETDGLFKFKTELTLNASSKETAKDTLLALNVAGITIDNVSYLFDNEHLVGNEELVEEGFFSGHDPLDDLKKNYNLYVSQAKRDPANKDLTPEDFKAAYELCISTKCKATQFKDDKVKQAYSYLVKRCSPIDKSHVKQGSKTGLSFT